jgi:septum formation protein
MVDPIQQCDFMVRRISRRPFLVLASRSPRRIQLLRRAGMLLRVCSPRVREIRGRDGLANRRLTPRAIAMQNARRKALAVSPRFPRRWVLGADTVVVLGACVLGKPADRREAGQMLRRLSGRTHQVITAFCLCRGRTVRKASAVTTQVTFKRLSAREIRTYLRLIDPLDKAGAYAFQEHGDRIIRRVRGSRTNVIGLPMEALQRYFRRELSPDFIG